MNSFETISAENELRELACVGFEEIPVFELCFPLPLFPVASDFLPLPFYGVHPDGNGLLPKTGF